MAIRYSLLCFKKLFMFLLLLADTRSVLLLFMANMCLDNEFSDQGFNGCAEVTTDAPISIAVCESKLREPWTIQQHLSRLTRESTITTYPPKARIQRLVNRTCRLQLQRTNHDLYHTSKAETPTREMIW